MTRERELVTVEMRLDGPGVTHDYVACGDCGAPLSEYAMDKRTDCPTHQRMRAIIAAGNERKAAQYFHWQPHHGTFGSLFLKPQYWPTPSLFEAHK